MIIGVIGAGQMGAGIAQVSAGAGHDVLLSDIDMARAEAGKASIAKGLGRLVAKEKMTQGDADALLGRIAPVADHAAFAPAELVIEAATEREEIKRAIFASVGKHLSDSAILASNTSSIPITRLAQAAPDPARFIGVHFFNPVPVMALLELVRGILTSDETLAVAQDIGARLGKTTVVAKDSPGFIVNRLLIPYIIDAIKLYEAGLATKEDIDAGVKLGLAHPMGPLTLTDLVGLDTTLAVADVLYAEYGEPRFKAPPLLRQMVTAGLLGRKSGRGFYTYGS
ncbi:MAG: 3-hydroxybutyryl-CoA dehydrogenase [Caldilineales bacterium]|nr:3-hydroxybutyryl-CoA dehydrogenase [Caldilineales bacterium]